MAHRAARPSIAFIVVKRKMNIVHARDQHYNLLLSPHFPRKIRDLRILQGSLYNLEVIHCCEKYWVGN